ncbi:thiamine phosphate synthase [Niallia circulans]|uniref:Thiamine phosphate synthase n=1 Tax=Niallia circulans TaxID=1397 RepID=A0A553SGF7_NIACI|nr:thiamine phosphate synthase [Niallia circulans]TRZ36076.1 thiamine phosphate synthase [Niallia circulans]
MKLAAITNDSFSVEKTGEIILKILPYVDYVHIREKSKSMLEIYCLCKQLLAKGADKRKIIVNGRGEILLLANMLHVHLPEKGLPIEAVRKKTACRLAGRSVHSLQSALDAEREGADYLLYGHCFHTESKRGVPPNGIKILHEIKKQVSIPVYAIGGITEELVSEINNCGADGIAIMSGIFGAENPQLAAQNYYERCKVYANSKV